MAKKEDVHLQLSEELAGIDIELDKALEALSETNHRIDSFLNDDDEGIGTDQANVAKAATANVDDAAAMTENADEVDDADGAESEVEDKESPTSEDEELSEST